MGLIKYHRHTHQHDAASQPSTSKAFVARLTAIALTQIAGAIVSHTA